MFRCSTDRGFYLATLTDEVPDIAKSVCTGAGEWISSNDEASDGVSVNAFPADEMLIHAIENSGKGYCTFRAGFAPKATAQNN
jgi:hypothetical protein